MAVNSSIPKQWNGIPTEYNFFDGYRRAGFGMKIVYCIGAIGVASSLLFGGFPGLLAIAPIVMEYNRYKDSSKAAKQATEHLIASTANATSNEKKVSTPDISQAPDLNPDAPQNGQFQANLSSQSQSAKARQR